MDIDNKLKKSGVKFLPWEGEKYEYGVSFNDSMELIYGDEQNKGKKLLILGESHYCADENDVKYDFTKEIIRNYIDPNTEHEPYMNTYTKFSKALVGKDNIDREKLWNHIAFYNYIQEPMKNPRMMPSIEQYRNAAEAFIEVLDTLQPDYVIAWGIRLYNNLPPKGKQGDDLYVDSESFETWKYTISSRKEVSVLGIYHPSTGFDWSFWHKVLLNYLSK